MQLQMQGSSISLGGWECVCLCVLCPQSLATTATVHEGSSGVMSGWDHFQGGQC